MWSELLGAGSILGGSALNSLAQKGVNASNEALQREFAQNSIQWKVADAKKAGIHPLAALGASGYTAQPSAVGASNGIAEAGQKLSDGLKGILDENAKKLSDLQVRDAELEVLKKQMELKNMGQTLSGNNIFQPPGGLASSILKKPNGSAPSAGISNPDAQAEFNKNYKVGQNMHVAPLPGEKDYFLTFSPDSTQGQALAESSTLPPFMPLWDMYRIIDDKLIDEIEDTMKAQGGLKPNQRISRSMFNYSPYGYYIKIEDGPRTTFNKESPYQKWVKPIDDKNEEIIRRTKKEEWDRLEKKFLKNRRRFRGSFLNR